MAKDFKLVGSKVAADENKEDHHGSGTGSDINVVAGIDGLMEDVAKGLGGENVSLLLLHCSPSLARVRMLCSNWLLSSCLSVV